MARIDPELAKSHLVVGFDLHSEKDLVSRHGDPEHHAAWGTLYLFDRSRIGDGEHIDDYRDDEGALPVTAVDIPDRLEAHIGEFLARRFKRVDIRASLRRDGEPMPLRPVDVIEQGEEE